MKTIFCILWLSLWLSAGCGQAKPIPLPTAAPGDASRGETLFQQTLIGTKNAPGCINCHSLAPGVTLVGPSLAGIGTRASTIIKQAHYTGQAKQADAFLREAILQPNAYVEAGFQPDVMRTTSADELSPQAVADLVAFLQTLQ